MKKQKGFSIVVLLVVIAALSVIAASGYMVYSTQKNNNSDSSNSTTTSIDDPQSSEKEDENNDAAKTNYTIRYINPNNKEQGITLYTAADLSNLPADFPVGAIELMKKDIGVQLDPGNPELCTQAYSVAKYNDVNVGGGQ